MRPRAGAAILWVLAGVAVAAATGWGALALYYLGPGPAGMRLGLAWGFSALGLAVLAGFCFRRSRRFAAAGFVLAFLPVLAVWFGATASDSRDWQPEVAVLPYATFDGDRVTVHSIRDFDYRSETDFTPRYYDKTFDLKQLDRVDLLASYWMGPDIAHLFVSFGFGEDHLAISIEARKDRARPYATLPGFFKQYELAYIVADERDVVRVRTNYRKDPPEQVYLYRVVSSMDNARRVFLDYLRDINELREHPRFYNTLTTNCTTMILAHTAMNPGHVPYSWKVLLSGHAPEYAYEQGKLDRSLPFEELRRRSLINPAAQAADQAADFSQRIRTGLP
jgi:hypothetical protein